MKTFPRWLAFPALACLVVASIRAVGVGAAQAPGKAVPLTSTSAPSNRRSYKPFSIFMITLDLTSTPPASDLSNYACNFTYTTTGGTSQTDAWDFISAKQHGSSNTVTLKFLARRTQKPKAALDNTGRLLTGTGSIVVSFPSTATIPATDPILVDDVGADPCDDN